MAANPVAIEIRDLTVVRGENRVLEHLSLDIAAGQITGLLGPSGSGKTTLMRAIVGVQLITGGSIQVLGIEAGSGALRTRVGYVTQAPAVYTDLTVRENLTYFSRIVGTNGRVVDEVIATVELSAFADRVAGTLSGGQRARLSLATALLNRPEVLVLDEPTVGLDPVLRRDLWETFHALAAAGATLLVSSHVMDEAERCDRLVLLREGAVLASESLESLLARTGARDAEQAFLTLVEGTPAP